MRITCRRCKRLLFVANDATGTIEIKCGRCKLINVFELAATLTA